MQTLARNYLQGLVVAVGAAGTVGLLGVTAGLANSKACLPCKRKTDPTWSFIMSEREREGWGGDPPFGS